MVVLIGDERTHTDGAFRAGLVFDDHRLAPALTERIGEYPSRRIIRASGRERHNQLHRTFGPVSSCRHWDSKNRNAGRDYNHEK